MLDKLIQEKADLISYSQLELDNIRSTLSYLKSIVQSVPEFQEPYLGGSFKRNTMVKGISDVDVYFRYMGTGNSQSALSILKNRLIASYPNTIVKQDKPSILVDFNKIPFNITPYRQDYFNSMNIPDNTLVSWRPVNIDKLEALVNELRKKGKKYIDLIKVLKLWNFNYRKGIKNFEIEIRVCTFFLQPMRNDGSLADLLWTFLQNNGFVIDAQKIHTLMFMADAAKQKSEWLKFIDRKN